MNKILQCDYLRGVGGLGISSDGDDLKRVKIKTQKNFQGFQQTPQKSLDQTLTPQKCQISKR